MRGGMPQSQGTTTLIMSTQHAVAPAQRITGMVGEHSLLLTKDPTISNCGYRVLGPSFDGPPYGSTNRGCNGRPLGPSVELPMGSRNV
eukprot:6159855-Pyramimonas_sp.AAC.1